MKRKPLPDPLSHATFTVATGVDAGASLRRLRAHDLDASVWGVRSTGTPSTVEHRCILLAVRLGKHVIFSHSTAALLYGAPLPFELELDKRLHASVVYPARAPHANGIRGHSLHLAAEDVWTWHRLRVTSPSRTWCDLAAVLNLFDLVALGDYLINERQSLTTIDALTSALSTFVGRRGCASAREALVHLDGRAESRPESTTRVIMALGGLPAPRVNHSIVHTEDGTIVRPDFEFTEYRVIVEYQGDYHRLTKEQWRKDMTRRSRLEAHGWVVIEINANDLLNQSELVTRIATVLRRQGWTG